jgi:hypothetical protein
LEIHGRIFCDSTWAIWCGSAPKRYALRLKLRGGEAAALAAAREILVRLYGEDGEFTVAAAEDLLPGPSGKYRRTHAEFRLDEWSLVEGGFPHA